jgi:hypothetical protein
LPLAGIQIEKTTQRRIPFGPSSLIQWEGEVNFVAIGILGEWEKHHRHGIVRELSGNEASFIELEEIERDWDRRWRKKRKKVEEEEEEGKSWWMGIVIGGMGIVGIVKGILWYKKKTEERRERRPEIVEELSEIYPKWSNLYDQTVRKEIK